MLDVYGNDLFQLVTYDAGANSLENAAHVNVLKKHYLFSLKLDQKTLFELAETFLNNKLCRQKLYQHTEQDRAGTVIISTLYGCSSKIMLQKTEWSEKVGLKQILMLDRKVIDLEGNLQSQGCRYFVSNLDLSVKDSAQKTHERQLTHADLYRVIRGHWAVENNCHNIFDVSFREDERHWIEGPKGNLNILIARRLIYNLLAYFKSCTQRGTAHRSMTWRKLFSTIYITLLQLSEEAYGAICVNNRGSPRLAT